MNLLWFKYIDIWVKHSIFYSFTFTLTSTLYQAYAIRILGFEVNELGNIVFVGLVAIALGNIVAIPLLYAFRHRRIFIWKVFTSLNIISWSLTGFSDTLHSVFSQHLLFLLLAVAQFTGAIGGLAYSDTIADLIPKEKSVRVFSKTNVLTVLASLLSLTLSLITFTYLGATPTGYRVCYSAALISAVISSAFLWLMKDLTPRSAQKISLNHVLTMYRTLFLDANCKRYVMAIALFTFFVNLPTALWNYYIINVFNGNELWISLNTISSTFASTLGSYILSYISHKLNPKKTIEYSTLSISFVPVIFIASSTLERQVLMNIYSGLSWAGFNLMSNIYNLYLAGENRLYLISLLGILSNLSASIASRLGSTIASIGLVAMQLVFVASTLGRLITYLYIRKRLPNI